MYRGATFLFSINSVQIFAEISQFKKKYIGLISEIEQTAFTLFVLRKINKLL